MEVVKGQQSTEEDLRAWVNDGSVLFVIEKRTHLVYSSLISAIQHCTVTTLKTLHHFIFANKQRKVQTTFKKQVLHIYINKELRGDAAFMLFLFL